MPELRLKGNTEKTDTPKNDTRNLRMRRDISINKDTDRKVDLDLSYNPNNVKTNDSVKALVSNADDEFTW